MPDGPIDAAEFAALMAPLGPFGSAPHLAAAVSGGADSMALALLADAWARARGGSLLAFVVDHGLRPESATEAAQTVQRLHHRGIPAQLLVLTDLAHGRALAERARAARYDILRAACIRAGALHLLLAHHAADQAETVLMRQRSGSGPAGLAAMPTVAEYRDIRLVRPLLPIPPVRLRATLREACVAWVEDPSNADQRALRSRLRAFLADPDGTGPAIAVLCASARAAGVVRAAADVRVADILAARASLRPEGFALLSSGSIDPAALAALLQAVSGAAFPPATRSVAALAAAPQPATLAGVRVLPAGRLGPGLLLVREQAAIGPPEAARPGAVWDGRFRLAPGTMSPDGLVRKNAMDNAMRPKGSMPEDAVPNASALQRLMPEDAVPDASALQRLLPNDAMPDATPPEGSMPEHMIISALGDDSARLRGHSTLPAAVLRTLPALRRGNSLVAVPHLHYPGPEYAGLLAFMPRRPAAGAPFLPANVQRV